MNVPFLHLTSDRTRSFAIVFCTFAPSPRLIFLIQFSSFTSSVWSENRKHYVTSWVHHPETRFETAWRSAIWFVDLSTDHSAPEFTPDVSSFSFMICRSIVDWDSGNQTADYTSAGARLTDNEKPQIPSFSPPRDYLKIDNTTSMFTHH